MALRQFINDNRTQFVSTVMYLFTDCLETEQISATAYDPAVNPEERRIRELKTYLAIQIGITTLKGLINNPPFFLH